MSETGKTPRRFTEKEVGLILRRATEMQRAEPTARDPEGLTLAELQEIAGEAGIDQVLLRRAAAELDALDVSSIGDRLAGAPLTVVVERSVAGEYPAERLGDLLPLLHASSKWQGTASQVGGTFTWTARSDANTSSRQVIVSVRDGETVLRLEERLGGLAGALFGGLMGGVGAGVGLPGGSVVGGLLGSVAVAVILPVVALAGSYGVARAIFAAQVRRSREAAHRLVDRLAEQVEAAAGGAPAALPGEGTDLLPTGAAP